MGGSPPGRGLNDFGYLASLGHRSPRRDAGNG
jgi:hypothetical protein